MALQAHLAMPPFPPKAHNFTWRIGAALPLSFHHARGLLVSLGLNSAGCKQWSCTLHLT